MGKSGEFYTFDQVLQFWNIDETKLKRLVSEGEIRAFREGDEMKFRKSDVENLDLTGTSSEEETGVIDLSAGSEDSSETLTDDLIFDEGDDLDLTAADAGMATAEISSQDTFVDEGIGMSTEPLGVDPNEMTEVIDADEAEEAGRPARRREPLATARAAGPPEEPKDVMWGILLTVNAIVMVMAMFVILGIRDTNTDEGKAPEFASNLASNFYTK